MSTRLNKYLASCGVGSRRACDAIIQEGRVYINNAICNNPATQVTENDIVRLGKKILRPKLTEAILFNKPRGLVCTSNDELGRETIYAALPQKLHHLKNVGRLDMESEGLLVLTNDGTLTQKLTHPGHKIEKEYIVTLNQAFDNEIIDKLIAGVHTIEGKAAAKSIRRLSPRRASVVLETGLKRQIRLMFEAVHLRVTKLVRVRIGSLSGGGIGIGEWRTLEPKEIELLTQNPTHHKISTGLEKAKRHHRVRPAKKAAKKTAKRASSRFSNKKTTNFRSQKPTPQKKRRRK